MNVVLAAARGSRNRCMEHKKRRMTARLPDMHWTISGQLTDITVRVMAKFRVKRKCNAWATDKTFFLYRREWDREATFYYHPEDVRHLFGPVVHRFTPVIRQFPCVPCSSTDGNWTSTRQGTHEFRTNARQRITTVHPAGALFRWSPFQVLCMHKTFRRTERTSPDKARIRRMRNGQGTHADGNERIENFILRRMSVNAIR